MDKISASRKIMPDRVRQVKNRKVAGCRRILKKLPVIIKASLRQSESFLKQCKKQRSGSQDESGIGLHTIQSRKLTGRGIKPQGKVLS
ncbi:hypothetical protein [Microcoleus sp. F4-D5]|uniref:hypothetical protein n=1 Tax=Microcoleus sp. F4-D5 TaxID=2818760 RepID=UPI002FD628C2